MKAYFILDKWCAANKSWGPSAWETNFVSSFDSLKKYEYSTFHFDEFHDQYPGENANEALIESLKKESPDFIFLVIYQKPGRQDTIISIDSLKKIQEQLHIPIVTIFGDLEHREQEEILKIVEPYMSLILYTALASPGIRLKNPKVKYTFVPKDQSIFFGEINGLKKIEIGYYGSSKPERKPLLTSLLAGGVPIIYGGGEREENLPVQDLAQKIRDTKICLSFSRAAYCHTTNARSIEVIACNSMLLEQEGMETPKLLKPFEDFIPYFSVSDCLDKAKYFMNMDAERAEISNNGHKKYMDLFSARKFWTSIFNYLVYSSEVQFKAQSLVINYKLNGKEFWQLNLENRCAPKFSKLDYEGYPQSLRKCYYLLDKFMTYEFLYSIFRGYKFCINLIYKKYG